MKKIILLLSLLIVSYQLFSQLSFGPRLGISSSKVKVDENFTYNGEDISYKTAGSSVGFHAGVFGRLQVVNVYVQPEILYTSSRGKISVESGNRGEEIRELTYNKLDIPVMIGLKFLKIVRVQAGPKFCLLLSDGAREIDVYKEVKEDYNQATIGYQLGVGLDIYKFYIDLKYESNLSKLGKSVTIGDQEFDTSLKNPLIILAVGFNIL